MLDRINKYKKKLADSSLEEFLEFFTGEFGNRIAIASSLSIEDQVITHAMYKINPDARIFIIDTGRLHQETYDLMAEMRNKYSFNFEIFKPDPIEVEKMISQHGPDLFYDSVEKRKLCCYVRKVKPLNRVLSTLDSWITGLRKEQALSRTSIEKIEIHEDSETIKLNPLTDWPIKKVWDYIKDNGIPYNGLYDKGYTSIGCQPCTRAVKNGENIRAGRWWWEEKDSKECGMHSYGDQ